jgi:hypothetical protein
VRASLPLPTTQPTPNMPWTTITLNDGTRIPSIGFGTWRIGNGADTVANVKTAIDTGFAHVGPCARLYAWRREALMRTQTRRRCTATRSRRARPSASTTATTCTSPPRSDLSSRTLPAHILTLTQWSGLNGLSAEESIHNSLKYVRLLPSLPSSPV